MPRLQDQLPPQPKWRPQSGKRSNHEIHHVRAFPNPTSCHGYGNSVGSESAIAAGITMSVSPSWDAVANLPDTRASAEEQEHSPCRVVSSARSTPQSMRKCAKSCRLTRHGWGKRPLPCSRANSFTFVLRAIYRTANERRNVRIIPTAVNRLWHTAMTHRSEYAGVPSRHLLAKSLRRHTDLDFLTVAPLTRIWSAPRYLQPAFT